MEEKKGLKESQKLRVEFVSTLMVTAISVAVTVFAIISMAWFSSNREVNADNTSVTVDSELFELGVDENNYAIGTFLSALTGEGYFNSTDLTDTSKTAIICKLLIDTCSDPLNPDTPDIFIRPGSEGSLVFELHPRKTNLNFRIDWSVLGIKHPDFSTYALTDESDTDDAETLALLKGHILIFKTRTQDPDTGEFVYSDRLDPDEPFYVTNATSVGTYTVTLYWVWARTYEDLYLHYGFTKAEIDSDTNGYFSYGGEIEEIGYNEGDQKIGDMVKYIVAEIRASAAEVVGTPTVMAAASE